MGTGPSAVVPAEDLPMEVDELGEGQRPDMGDETESLTASQMIVHDGPDPGTHDVTATSDDVIPVSPALALGTVPGSPAVGSALVAGDEAVAPVSSTVMEAGVDTGGQSNVEWPGTASGVIPPTAVLVVETSLTDPDTQTDAIPTEELNKQALAGGGLMQGQPDQGESSSSLSASRVGGPMGAALRPLSWQRSNSAQSTRPPSVVASGGSAGEAARDVSVRPQATPSVSSSSASSGSDGSVPLRRQAANEPLVQFLRRPCE